MSRPSKSLWEQITSWAPEAAPVGADLLPLATQPGTPFVTQMSSVSVTDLAGAIGPIIGLFPDIVDTPGVSVVISVDTEIQGDFLLPLTGTLSFGAGRNRFTSAAGELTYQDPLAVTGITRLNIRLGAGQGAVNPLSVRVADNATNLFQVTPTGVAEAASSVFSGGDFRASAAGFFYWQGRSGLDSPADSVIRMANQAGTNFNRLQFGGTAATFPSLKRSTTELQVRLADDSAYGGFDALSYKVGGVAGVSFTGTGAALAALTTVTFVNGILTAATP